MLFTGREVRMGKNTCARGLEYGPRPKTDSLTQDQGHSFFSHTDRASPVNNIFIIFFGCLFLSCAYKAPKTKENNVSMIFSAGLLF